MVIEYEKSKYEKQIHKIEIEDTRNVFLEGKNAYDGLSTYFGIWNNDKYLVIVTLISGRNISYSYSLNKNIYTERDIKSYLEHNNNIKVISKSDFKKQLKKVISLIEIS